MLTSGGTTKTQNYRMAYWWPTEGEPRDFAMFTAVGQWVVQNMKVLDKKPAPEVCKLVAEQFPKLADVEVTHKRGPMARWKT